MTETLARFDRGATQIDFFAGLADTVAAAIAEDIGTGDVTASLIPASHVARARVIVREAAVLCGIPWFNGVYRQLDSSVRISWRVEDGARLAPDDVVCEIAGNARVLVTGERPALNFLQTLSGTATTTADYLRLLSGTHTRLLDTRKTLPGLRRAQKYAVKCGGGNNHRAGLYDGVLIKENHIAAAGSITAAVHSIRQQHPAIPIEVEVEFLTQIDEAIAAGADMLLLDNFSLAQMREAVRLTQGKIPLEASGGFSREDLGAVAATGVDFISVGSLTKHLRATDYSMRIDAL